MTSNNRSSNNRSSNNGYALAVGAYLIWGLAPIYWKQVSSVPSVQLAALRCLQTLIVLLTFLAVVRRRYPWSLWTNGKAARSHLTAAVMLGLNWLIFVYAVATDRVVEASLGYFINPLLSVLLGAVLFGERLGRQRQLAIGLAFVGVCVLGVEAGSLPWISLVLASSFAVYGVLKKRSTIGPVEGLSIEMMWLAPIAAGYLIWVAQSGEFGGTTEPVPAWVWLVGVMTVTPLLLFGGAAQKIPLWAIGLLQYLAPTLQFLIGVFVYDEQTSPTRLVGFVIIWAGLIVFAMQRPPKQVPARLSGLAASS